MKIYKLLIACLAALALTTAPAQSPDKNASMVDSRHLTRFDLDFPGGTPKDLVAAIQKALGKPLNAIIPEEFVGMKLPPLKMNNVDAPQLFAALEQASYKSVAYVTGTTYGGFGGPTQSYSTVTTAYGFKTSGTPTDDSIWYFHVDKPAGPPLVKRNACHFYPLATYLERGLTVDDITTAIQTGWKMQDESPVPQISFHKETKLLIAVGEPAKLETIDAVLKALELPKPNPAIDPTTGLPVSTAAPKAKP